MSYIKMDSHWLNHSEEGVQVAVATLTLPLPGGLTVEFNAPIIPLGNDVAIMPVFEPDGAHAIRFRLDRWSPLHLNPVRRFPLNFEGQDTAIRVARAIEADPAARWDFTAEEALAWCQTWAAQPTH
jgi:hypothetical protein